MTRAQHHAKPSGTWLALFNEQRATLTAVVEMLLPSRGSSRPGSRTGSHFFEESTTPRHLWEQICAIRAVVKAAIAYKLKNPNCASEAEAPVTPKHQFHRIPHVGMLPWPERAVYFLREVLRFSRRDTALLLGMSDGNIRPTLQVCREAYPLFQQCILPTAGCFGFLSEVRSDRSMAMRF